MRYCLLLSFFVVVVSASSLEPSEEANRHDSDAISCGPWPIRRSFYRAYRADIHDHFYTTDFTEWQNAITYFGYTGEGTTGAVYIVSTTYSVPLYRLWHTGMLDHFYTTNQTERNEAINLQAYRDEGVAGHVLPASTVEPLCPCPEARPLYRLFKEGNLTNFIAYDHFYTVNVTEKALFVSTYGYIDQGLAACIFPPGI